ncbi:hypothetical protein FRC08_001291 [Ceratobasidium sp. 394]|nr:hypothetical protein FRC08_001291 [Ceratobasidium sp. 394]
MAIKVVPPASERSVEGSIAWTDEERDIFKSHALYFRRHHTKENNLATQLGHELSTQLCEEHGLEDSMPDTKKKFMDKTIQRWFYSPASREAADAAKEAEAAEAASDPASPDPMAENLSSATVSHPSTIVSPPKATPTQTAPSTESAPPAPATKTARPQVSKMKTPKAQKKALNARTAVPEQQVDLPATARGLWFAQNEVEVCCTSDNLVKDGLDANIALEQATRAAFAMLDEDERAHWLEKAKEDIEAKRRAEEQAKARQDAEERERARQRKAAELLKTLEDHISPLQDSHGQRLIVHIVNPTTKKVALWLSPVLRGKLKQSDLDAIRQQIEKLAFEPMATGSKPVQTNPMPQLHLDPSSAAPNYPRLPPGVTDKHARCQVLSDFFRSVWIGQGVKDGHVPYERIQSTQNWGDFSILGAHCGPPGVLFKNPLTCDAAHVNPWYDFILDGQASSIIVFQFGTVLCHASLKPAKGFTIFRGEDLTNENEPVMFYPQPIHNIPFPARVTWSRESVAYAKSLHSSADNANEAEESQLDFCDVPGHWEQRMIELWADLCSVPSSMYKDRAPVVKAWINLEDQAAECGLVWSQNHGHLRPEQDDIRPAVLVDTDYRGRYEDERTAVITTDKQVQEIEQYYTSMQPEHCRADVGAIWAFSKLGAFCAASKDWKPIAWGGEGGIIGLVKVVQYAGFDTHESGKVSMKAYMEWVPSGAPSPTDPWKRKLTKLDGKEPVSTPTAKGDAKRVRIMESSRSVTDPGPASSNLKPKARRTSRSTTSKSG